MELNEPFEGHEHATTSLKVILLVFALVLVGALAYLVSVTYNQPDTTEETAPSVTDKTEEGATSDWKTYTDPAGVFSFMYPPTLPVVTDASSATSIFLKTYSLSTMEDEPLGYDKETLVALRDDLKNGKVKTAITGMYAKETLTLRQVEICDTQFTYTLDVFNGDDTMVHLIYALAGNDKTTAITNNAAHFTTDSANCGTEKIWKDTGEEDFRTALTTGQTDTLTKKWHTDFGLITKSFKFLQ